MAQYQSRSIVEPAGEISRLKRTKAPVKIVRSAGCWLFAFTVMTGPGTCCKLPATKLRPTEQVSVAPSRLSTPNCRRRGSPPHDDADDGGPWNTIASGFPLRTSTVLEVGSYANRGMLGFPPLTMIAQSVTVRDARGSLGLSKTRYPVAPPPSLNVALTSAYLIGSADADVAT